MAAISSIRSGGWSDTNTATNAWGATPPTSADTVTIVQTSTGGQSFTTNTAGYATTSTVITLTGSVAAGSYVVGEGVQFGTDPNFYVISAWNSGTKVLTLSTGLLVAIPAAATTVYARGHIVTLDGTGCVCSTLTIDGTVTATTSVNSTLTANGQIFMPNNRTSMFSVDLSAAPAVNFNLVMNAARAAGTAGQFWALWQSSIILKGAARTRKTTITADATGGSTTTLTVSDATGWRQGDTLVLATTQAYNATPKTSVVTIHSSYTNGSTTVPLVAAPTNTHLTGGYIGNFSSNVIAKPSVAADSASFQLNVGFPGTDIGYKEFRNVLFTGFKATDSSIRAVVGYQANGAAIARDLKSTFAECAFYENSGFGFALLNASASPSPIDKCVFYASANVDNGYNSPAITSYGTTTSPLYVTNCGIFRNTGASGTYDGIGSSNSASLGLEVSDTFVSCCSGYGFAQIGTSMVLSNVEIFSNNIGLLNTASSYVARNANIGTFTATGGSACTNGTSDTSGALTVATFSNCKTQSLSLTSLAGAYSAHTLSFVNKDNDVTSQEIYRPFMSVKRENTIKNRSTSSVAIRPTKISTNCQRTLSIPCANGSSIRVIGYVQRQSSATQVATVALSGLGSAWGGFTAANNTTWQVWDTGTITNSSGADGNFTLTYTASDTSSTSGVVYFDGVPDSPFVTKCRHYGYTFDEANPVRTVNGTIQQATETTAIGYTGITIAGSTTVSPVTLTASKVFQDVYDYSQAYACANLTYTPSFTATGSAGSPALIALANVTTTGYTLNGGGTLAMGAYTLTASGYSYTGGTFAQASTVPSFTGGTLSLGAAGAFTLTLASAILQMTPTAPSTYNFSASSFSGTIDLRNTAAHAITVSVPSGATFITTNNTGGTITVSAPTVNQTITVTGFTAGSRIQIYDYSTAAPVGSRELFNGTATGGNAVITGSTCVWTDPLAAVATRDIRVRVAYVSGATAKEFIEANIGTCGTTAPSNAISYLVSQTNDTTYNSNAVTGSTVTGITFTDAATDLVNCNIAGGSVAWKDIYAAFVYWNFTATGIANDFTYVAAPDTANYLLSGMKIRNTSAVDLSVISGYGRDATTGLSKDIIDTAGSTGNIFLAPDHVVPYQTTGTYAITGDPATVAAAVLSAAATTPIQADIRKVNNITVNGDGAGTPWGP